MIKILFPGGGLAEKLMGFLFFWGGAFHHFFLLLPVRPRTHAHENPPFQGKAAKNAPPRAPDSPEKEYVRGNQRDEISLVGGIFFPMSSRKH